MKKVRILLILGMFLFIPVKIYALEGSISITCDSLAIYTNKTNTCTISGNSSDIVTGFEGIFTFDENLDISSFQLLENWNSMFDSETITSGIKIYAVAKAGEESNISGKFDIAKFNVTIKDNAETLNQQIKLSSMVFYDENVEQINITDDALVEFSDFLEINDYKKNDDKKIIYGLSNSLSVESLLTKINSNGVLNIIDIDNNIITDEMKLRTGYKLRVTFKSNILEYKISVIGDVLGEGSVTLNGAKAAARQIIDGDFINEEEHLMAADMNEDGIIKMNDVMRMMNIIKSNN